MSGSVLVAIEGLPPWFEHEDLEALCCPFGTVLSTKVVRDTATYRSLQLGFVKMGTTDAAQRVLNDLHTKEVSGHVLRVTIVHDTA